MGIRICWHWNHAEGRPLALQKIRGREQVEIAGVRIVKEICHPTCCEIGRLIGLVNPELGYRQGICGDIFWQGARLDGLDNAGHGR